MDVLKRTRPAKNMQLGDLAKDAELRERRTGNSKTFKLSKNKNKVILSKGPLLHYKKDNELREIDLTIKADNTCQKAPYYVEILTSEIGYNYTSKSGGNIMVTLDAIDGVPFKGHKGEIEKDGNILLWKDVAVDLDMSIVLSSNNVEIFKHLKTDKAPKEFTWLIKEGIGAKCSFSKKTAGIDNEKHPLEIETSVKDEKKFKNHIRYKYTETWTGRVSRIVNKLIRKKAWNSNPVYPVVVDASTGEIDIAADTDDAMSIISGTSAYFQNTGPSFGFGKISYPYPYTTPTTTLISTMNTGLRFQLPIPQGATITSAVLKMYTKMTGGTPKGKLYANDVDDAAVFAQLNLMSSITKTSESVEFSPTGAVDEWTSASITDVIQEVISRSGWVSDNHVGLAIFNNHTAINNMIAFEASDSDGGHPAQIEVEYELGGGSGYGNSFNGIDDVGKLSGVAIANINSVSGVE